MNRDIQKLLDNYPELLPVVDQIKQAYEILKQCYKDGGKLLLCGNGGSASDCEHIVGELMKGFVSKRPVSTEVREKLKKFGGEQGKYLADHLQGALPAISLVSHTALMTAFVNDVAADMVFAQQVFGYAKPNDVVLGISTSGHSGNVIRALQVANAIGVKTLGLTGKSGGQMIDICDAVICVPRENTADVQERHLPIYHTLCMMLEKEFFA